MAFNEVPSGAVHQVNPDRTWERPWEVLFKSRCHWGVVFFVMIPSTVGLGLGRQGSCCFYSILFLLLNVISFFVFYKFPSAHNHRRPFHCWTLRYFVFQMIQNVGNHWLKIKLPFAKKTWFFSSWPLFFSFSFYVDQIFLFLFNNDSGYL